MNERSATVPIDPRPAGATGSRGTGVPPPRRGGDFGESGRVVVDPTEERIIRIDEVKTQGQSRITESARGSNVAPFPVPYFRPDRGESSGS